MPWIDKTCPLEAKDQAYYRGNEYDAARIVSPAELLFPRQDAQCSILRWLLEETADPSDHESPYADLSER